MLRDETATVAEEFIIEQEEKVFGELRRDMPEKEAELTTLETARSCRPGRAAEAAEVCRKLREPKRQRSAGRSLTSFKADYEQLKAERDQLMDRLARTAGGV